MMSDFNLNHYGYADEPSLTDFTNEIFRQYNQIVDSVLMPYIADTHRITRITYQHSQKEQYIMDGKTVLLTIDLKCEGCNAWWEYTTGGEFK